MAVGSLPVEAVAFVHNGVAQGAIGFTAATALQIGRAGVITLVVAAVTLHAITFHKTERPRCHQTVRWFIFRTQCWCIHPISPALQGERLRTALLLATVLGQLQV